MSGDRAPAWLRAPALWRSGPLWLGLAAVAATSWFYLVRMEAMMSAMAHGAEALGSGQARGDVGGLVMAMTMWAAMMLAMMLPTVAPSASVFARLSARRDPHRPQRPTACYVVGYAAPWIAFALPAALLQWGLAQAWLLDPMLRSSSTALNASILLGAGVYQFLPIKQACLSKCRTPLAFFLAEWRDGDAGAWQVGLRHGAYCVACCWALMAVMFVVGAMNLLWMGLLTLLFLAEKLVAPRWRVDQGIGLALLAAGLWVALPAVFAA